MELRFEKIKNGEDVVLYNVLLECRHTGTDKAMVAHLGVIEPTEIQTELGATPCWKYLAENAVASAALPWWEDIARRKLGEVKMILEQRLFRALVKEGEQLF